MRTLKTLKGIRTETCRMKTCRYMMHPGELGLPAKEVLSKNSRGWVCEDCVRRLEKRAS